MMLHVGDRDASEESSRSRRRPDRDDVADRRLRTDRAYDVAYWHLGDLLPGCRHGPIPAGCAYLASVLASYATA